MAKKVLLALALLFATIIFSGNVFAFSDEDVSVYGTIYLKGEKIIPISIANYSPTDKELTVDFIGTTKIDYEFLSAPEQIKANKKATIKLKLTPLSDSLVGKEYKSTLVVYLGNEMVRKEINVVFLPNTEGNVVIEGEDNTNGKVNVDTGSPLATGASINYELVVNIILAAVAVILAVMLIIRIREQ